MNLNQQVGFCSLELVKKLKELGVKIDLAMATGSTTNIYKTIDEMIDGLEALKWWLAQHKPEKSEGRGA